MPEKKNSLLDRLRTIIHWAVPERSSLMLSGDESERHKTQFTVISGHTTVVLERIERIKTIAEANGYKEILDIFDEDA